MKLNIEPVWQGQDVFVIGGGPSLVGFDWGQLHGRKTVGCNSAYKLGRKVTNICFFSDFEFFFDNYDGLREFKGTCVTHCTALSSRPEGWLWHLDRNENGLATDSLFFGGNSGVGAINLALLLGAKRVILLGFDCAAKNTKYHWDGENKTQPSNELFHKFQEGFYGVQRDLAKVFPGRQVINANPASKLKFFPIMSLSEALGK